MSGDEKLIRGVITDAEHDPDLWHRASGCRTVDGERCLPTMAVERSGAVFAGSPGEPLGEYVIAEEGDDPDEVIHIIHVHDRANRLIGKNLGDRWTLSKLRRLLPR
jgi:hypothetical protein